MPIVADLHLHSKYSRAVSQKMDLIEISKWASLKGINLVATGDWTHPLWLREIKSNLKEINPGIFTLVKKPVDQKYPVNFLLSTEISSIYTQGDKTRRVHNLIFAPSLVTTEKIIAELRSRGANLSSDGRPIIGLSSKELLELILEIDRNALLIPAHIWTPWFSLFGSKSGFISVDECFNDLSSYIYGIETGLSSDPIMNWQIKDLEKRSILSFSDAHSGPKLGREATVFVENKTQFPNSNFQYSFSDIADAIKQIPNSKLKIGYTIEFFPEEGKYHWSGHRNCNVKYSPDEVLQKGKICPVCHQPLTIGVENQIIDMAEKKLEKKDLIFIKNKNAVTFVGDVQKKRRPFISLVPLLEILVEINTSQVKGFRQYLEITNKITEFDLLLKTPLEEIVKIGGEKLRLAIEIVRNRQVFVDPGYDGVFGKVKIFSSPSQTNENSSQAKPQNQLDLF